MTMTSKKIPLVFANVEGVGSLAMSAYAATPGNDLTALICCQQPNSHCITIDYVYLHEYGYVTVYQSDAQGKPTGIPIGYVSLKAGNHRYINVTLNKQPKSGQKLWVSLYKDVHAKLAFYSGWEDDALWFKDQQPPERAFMVR